MERLEFEIQGSMPAPYNVSFEADDGVVHAFCSCEAGKKGASCKHRIALMDGDVTTLVSGNTVDVNRLKELLAGSSLEVAYKEVQEAAAMYEIAKKKLASAKKNLSKVMYG